MSKRKTNERTTEVSERERTTKSIPERGFDLTELDAPVITAIIRTRMWSNFCSQPPNFNMTIVREFYNNANKDLAQSKVRGVIVLYTRRALNDFYKLRQVNSFNWKSLLSNYKDKASDIVNNLSSRESLNGNGDEPVKWPVKSTGMHANAKAWINFISARLIPTTTTSEVTYERCLLAYLILENEPIDIGTIIHDQIRYCIKNTKRNLFFPSLITCLCVEAGVLTKPDDEVLKPKDPINAQIFRGYFEKTEEPRPISAPVPELPSRGTRIEATLEQQVATLIRGQVEMMKHIKILDKKTSANSKMLKQIAAKMGCELTDCIEHVSLNVPSSSRLVDNEENVEDDDEGVDERKGPLGGDDSF